MRRTVQRRTAIAFTTLMALLIPSLPAVAKPFADTSIVINGATSAEGIAAGTGTTFYAGDLALGDIYQGDIRTGTTGLLIDAPDGRMAVGMKFDPGSNLLFVAGGLSGTAYVYNTSTLESTEITLTTLAGSFINDVTLTPEGAWFTNSKYPELYFVPFDGLGDPNAVETKKLTDQSLVLADPSMQFGLNGIASAKGGRVLFVAHTQNQAIYTVNADPESGESARIRGVTVPSVDGILVQGQRLWAVQNFDNKISRIDLSNNFSSGVVEDVITSDGFNSPATAALFGNTLAAVNAQFLLPDIEYEVVLVPARL
jgi:sugar lactone lactonase YvrE